MAKIREDTMRFLADVPEEYVFRCHDSCIFRNMRELRDGLSSMPEEVYSYHVNLEKNDFSNWVRDVIKDDRLAADLRASKSKTDAASRVNRRIGVLSRQ